MILGFLGLASVALAFWVIWLLADGVRALLARRAAEARKRAGRTPLRLVVTARQEVTQELFRLTLAPRGGGRLPRFRPGQYLSVRTPAGARRYSLAAWAARPRAYHLGIRRVEGGAVSAWLHAHARVGAELEVLPPAGDFVLEQGAEEVVLVAGGIGLTPMAAMVDALAARPAGTARVWLFHAARHGDELVDHGRYAGLERRNQGFHYRPWLSRPGPAWPGGQGRLAAADLVRELTAPKQAAYYLCARQDMMDGLAAGLQALGVPARAIRWESFGGGGNADGQAYRVTVAGHGSHVFQGEPSLLHALESWGVPVAADCRAGECGACALTVRRGEVRPCQGTQAALPAGRALACCAVPASDLEIVI